MRDLEVEEEWELGYGRRRREAAIQVLKK